LLGSVSPAKGLYIAWYSEAMEKYMSLVPDTYNLFSDSSAMPLLLYHASLQPWECT